MQHSVRLALVSALVAVGIAHAAPDRDPRSAIRASQQAAEAGRYDEALAMLRQEMQRRRGNAELTAARARVRWLQGKAELAETDLAEAFLIQPACAEAHVVRGEMLLKALQPADALPHFQRATEADPRHATAHRLAAEAHLGLEAPLNAIQSLNIHLRDVSPRDVAALTRRGQAHGRVRDYAKALTDLGKAIELDASHAEAYLQRARIHDSRRAYTEAVADYTKHLELQRTNLAAYRGRGFANYQLERWKDCIADLTKFLAANPRHVEGHMLRGNAYLRLATPDRALTDFDRILSLDKDHIGALFGKGQALDRLHKTEEAIKQYTRVIELEGSYVSAYLNRAIMHSKLNRGKEALDDANAAVALEPEYGPCYRIRGSFFSARGKLPEAIADFDKAIQLDEKDAYAYLGRGIAQRRSGKSTAALPDIDKALQLNPKLRNAYTQRASLYVSLNRLADARNDYERVAKMTSDGDMDETQAYCQIFTEVCAGNYDKGLALAEEHVTDYDDDPDWLYDLACAFAIAAEVVGKDEKLIDRGARKRRYADRALDLLEESVKHGYRNLTHMGLDYDFLVLREEPRFRKLLEVKPEKK